MITSDVTIGFKKIDFDPFEEGKEIDKVVPMNESQKEIWLSCVLGEEDSNLAYNESVSLALEGPFQPDFFIEAIQEVVFRHEALRSIISANGETLIIYKNLPIPVFIEDISAESDQKAFLDRFIKQQMLLTFNLQEDPLFRFFLHKKSETAYYFTLILHHIIADGWSTGIILQDLSRFYNARVQDIQLIIDKASQISDYAEEQSNFEESEEFRLTKNYWLNLYKNKVPVLNLPTDYPRPAVRTYKSERLDHSLSLDLIERIKTTGAKSGSSLVNTLLNAFEIFLYLKSNQRDIVVGLPTAGQAATEHFNLVGHCVNLLPIRSLIDPAMSFNHYLKTKKTDFFDAYDHQKFTYGQLIKSLNLKRDHSRIPLIPVVFNIDMGMDSSVDFIHLNHQLISNPRACETFEISLNATGSESSFIFEWSYNTQLFKKETIKKWAADFEQLLIDLSNDPFITIRELMIKNSKEWLEQLDQWNDTKVDYQKDLHFTALIDKAAAQYPDKTAVTYKNERLSYSELMRSANQFADYLIVNGLKKGDVIGLAIDRSIEMLISMLGLLKAGATYVPIDPSYPKERIEYMLTDSGASILLVSKTHSEKFQSNAVELIIENIWPQLVNYKNETPALLLKGTDIAYILYTSGSTGKPKGVGIMNYNLINLLTSLQVEPGMLPEDRLLAITTISFDIAAVELYLPLITGAELMICDKETTRDGRLLIDVLEEKKITVMQATPATWRMMIDSGWSKKYPLKIFCGGEPMTKDLADNLLDRAATLWNMYGPTETTIYSIIQQINKEDQQITIGRPVQNTQVYILNEEREVAARGEVGELFIGGDGVAAGYLNQPLLTEERFISNPFSKDPSAKIYQTGDLGKFTDNGEIQYFGRIDQQVKIRGQRVELGEIEIQLSKLSGIKQNVVLAREDIPSNIRLVAYIILDGKESDLSKLTASWKSSLKLQLPEHMVPGDFVILKAFPLTPNNKIDKKALPQPLSKNHQSGNNENMPQDKTEKMVYDIWSAVLGIKDISTQDDFFELGGHSLLAVKVMAAIEQQTSKRLPLASLFENSTIKKLAKRINSDKEEKWDSLVPIKTSGTKDPVYLIHGAGLNVLLFASISKYMDKEQPVYGMQALGLNRPVELLDTIEEIAAAYLTEIIESNPEGPYRFAGYSLGGKIAFEMARQLKQMDKEISFLGIIDTYATNRDLDHTAGRLTKKLIRQFKKIPFFFHSFIDHPKEAFDYQLLMTKIRVKQILSKHREEEYSHFSPYEIEIQDSYDKAYYTYDLKPSDFKVDLFRVQKRLYFLDDRVYLGWAEFAKKGVEVHEVPGDHRTFLYPPNDEGFAHILQSVLDKV